MLIKELIAELKKYDENMPVGVTWVEDGEDCKVIYKDDIKIESAYFSPNEKDKAYLNLSPKHIDLNIPFDDKWQWQQRYFKSVEKLNKEIDSYLLKLNKND